MISIRNSVEDVYKFSVGEQNPTVKKIVDGEETREIYNKDDVINVLQQAVNNGQTSCLKCVQTGDIKKYLFKFQEENNGKKNAHFVTIITDDIDPNYDKYISKLENMKHDTIKLNLKKNLKELVKYIALGVSVSAVAASIVYSDYKEFQIKNSENKAYIDEINNSKMKKNNQILNSVNNYLNDTGDYYNESELNESVGKKL